MYDAPARAGTGGGGSTVTGSPVAAIRSAAPIRSAAALLRWGAMPCPIYLLKTHAFQGQFVHSFCISIENSNASQIPLRSSDASTSCPTPIFEQKRITFQCHFSLEGLVFEGTWKHKSSLYPKCLPNPRCGGGCVCIHPGQTDVGLFRRTPVYVIVHSPVRCL